LVVNHVTISANHVTISANHVTISANHITISANHITISGFCNRLFGLTHFKLQLKALNYSGIVAAPCLKNFFHVEKKYFHDVIIYFHDVIIYFHVVEIVSVHCNDRFQCTATIRLLLL